MRTKLVYALLFGCLFVCLFGGLSSAQVSVPSGSLIVNGSFEDPVIAGSFKLFSSIPGWQPTGSCGSGNVDVEIDRNAFGTAVAQNRMAVRFDGLGVDRQRPFRAILLFILRRWSTPMIRSSPGRRAIPGKESA